MKRTIAVLAAGLVSVTLAGCGGGSSANAAAPAGTSAAAPAPANAANAAGGATPDDAASSAAHAALPTGMSSADAAAAGMGSDGAPIVSVTATDTTCKSNKSSVAAGKTWFKITNKGTKITELYLEKADSTELIQVERIRPGKSGAFSTTTMAGSYQVACEPGMNGHDTQIRTPITVQ
jgi:Cupredoxin-like domain